MIEQPLPLQYITKKKKWTYIYDFCHLKYLMQQSFLIIYALFYRPLHHHAFNIIFYVSMWFLYLQKHALTHYCGYSY